MQNNTIRKIINGEEENNLKFDRNRRKKKIINKMEKQKHDGNKKGRNK